MFVTRIVVALMICVGFALPARCGDISIDGVVMRANLSECVGDVLAGDFRVSFDLFLTSPDTFPTRTRNALVPLQVIISNHDDDNVSNLGLSMWYDAYRREVQVWYTPDIGPPLSQFFVVVPLDLILRRSQTHSFVVNFHGSGTKREVLVVDLDNSLVVFSTSFASPSNSSPSMGDFRVGLPAGNNFDELSGYIEDLSILNSELFRYAEDLNISSSAE